jgi:multisubunit Na+/H+ antiporter MnhB subunit
LAVLLQFLAFGEREVDRVLPIRFAPIVTFAGLTIALVVTFAPVAWGKPILTHAPPPDANVVHLGSVELITAVAFDVGVFLLVLGFAVSTIGLVARVHPRRAP